MKWLYLTVYEPDSDPEFINLPTKYPKMKLIFYDFNCKIHTSTRPFLSSISPPSLMFVTVVSIQTAQ